MNEEIKKAVKKLKVVTPQFLSSIITRGTLGGSRLYGGWVEDSDIDILLPPPHTNLGNKLYCMISTGHAYNTTKDYWENEVGDNFKSFYIRNHKFVYNLFLFTTQNDFDVRRQAGILINRIVCTNKEMAHIVAGNKKFRTELFILCKKAARIKFGMD